MVYLHLCCLFVAACGADAADGTQAGRFVVEHPTLLNLGFEWQIRGDANRNASVTVQYRQVNDPAWRPALPLLRIGGEKIYREREHLNYTVPEGFAGSVLNLQPGTEYECRFELTDPDGVVGETIQTIRATTRSEPQTFRDGVKRHVYPVDYEGVRQEPSFTSLMRRTGRLERGLGTEGSAGRYDPDARRNLPVRTTELRGSADDSVRWDHVTDPERDTGKTDHDQIGR